MSPDWLYVKLSCLLICLIFRIFYRKGEYDGRKGVERGKEEEDRKYGVTRYCEISQILLSLPTSMH